MKKHTILCAFFFLVCVGWTALAGHFAARAGLIDEFDNTLVRDYFPDDDEETAGEDDKVAPSASGEEGARPDSGLAPMPPAPAGLDPRTDRLCEESADPDGAADKIFIHCILERDAFRPEQIEIGADPTITIAAYNMERAYTLDKQIELFKTQPDLKEADIILLSEADRGCERTGYRHAARELAQALNMNFAYGVEFLEVGETSNDKKMETCEHGNAVLSRFPMVHAEQLRFSKSASYWYTPPEERNGAETRLGGRLAIEADLDVWGTPLRVYSIHLASAANDNALRASQAKDIIKHLDGYDGPVIVGGDANTGFYMMDLQTPGMKMDATPPVFFKAGFEDAHAAIKPPKARATSTLERGIYVVIDLMFARGVNVLESGVCASEDCEGLSDHFPIWTRFQLP